MDYDSSVDIDLIESLKYLRPPVKRKSNTNNIKDIFKSNTIRQPEGRESSTSLILKKTTERKVLEQYAILNCLDRQPSYSNVANLQHNQKCKTNQKKPTIKITVIPTTPQSQFSDVYRRRRFHPKRNPNTIANLEKSIHTKNVYLVVSGKKKEKVYEIKTTGSAKLFKDYVHHDSEYDDSVEQITSLKQVIDSLNMDKRRKKDKKKKVPPVPQHSYSSIKDVPRKEFNSCYCPNVVKNENALDVNCRKSCVRITGRLGLTDDDRVVFRCAASVDDKPVDTDDVLTEKIRSPTAMFPNTDLPLSNRRDRNTQADIWNVEINAPRNNLPRQESQATQVNFYDESANGLKRNQADVFLSECHCENTIQEADKVNKNAPDKNQNNINHLKKCQSPVVIISVYPNEDAPDNVKIVNQTIEKRCHLFSTPKEITACCSNFKPNLGPCLEQQLRYTDNNLRSNNNSQKRSNSPGNCQYNFKDNKICSPKNTKGNSNTRKGSPKYQTEATYTEPKTQRQVVSNITKRVRTDYIDKNRRRVFQRINKEEKSLVNTGTNTDHRMTKKALVDNYTRKIVQRMSNSPEEANMKGPYDDESKVTVNIDGEKERYDVLFQKGNVTTDLRVRKTAKDSNGGGAKRKPTKTWDKTMYNLHSSPDDNQRDTKLYSRVLSSDQPEDAETQIGYLYIDRPCAPRLTVRDSIEISHKREQSPHNINTESRKNDNNKIGNRFVPVKHYRGDDCSVPDPVKRDKEIRELLGIGNNKMSNIDQDLSKKSQNIGLHCYYQRKKCQENILTQLSIVPNHRCPVCCGDETVEPANGEKEESESPVTDSNDQMESNESYQPDSQSMASQYHDKNQYIKQVPEVSSVYQHMILNRNIQIFLQIEQFSKQKPIILSRKQYDKVKRAIDQTVSKKIGHRNNSPCKCNAVTVGSVRKLVKQRHSTYSTRGTQTVFAARNKKGNLQNDNASFTKRTSSVAKDVISRRSSNVSKGTLKSQRSQINYRYPAVYAMETRNVSNNAKTQYCRTTKITTRQAHSSVEIRYAGVSYMKHITHSSTDIEVGSITEISESLPQGDSRSIHTIFKGRRKCPTPNLGTSICSLCSEEVQYQDYNSIKNPMRPCDSKPKKPFLKRLMSCLVLRSSRASEFKITGPSPKLPSYNSSIDSYHISTSLGALEMSSSIYDTSASFYTNHSVHPVNPKMRRGFFNSVRGFLTNRRS